jgi:hypothetical protein
MAVAHGLRAFRDADWADEIGHGQTTITVMVKQAEVKLRVRDFEIWLEAVGRTPAEMSLKSRLRELSRNKISALLRRILFLTWTCRDIAAYPAPKEMRTPAQSFDQSINFAVATYDKQTSGVKRVRQRAMSRRWQHPHTANRA